MIITEIPGYHKEKRHRTSCQYFYKLPGLSRKAYMDAYHQALDEIAEAFEPYEYRDNVEMGENTVQEVMLDLRSGNIHSYISYLKDIVDEECDQSVRAGVLIERLKAYEPEIPKDMEPVVYVNYCEESGLMNPRCQKLSELDAKTA